MQTRSTNIHADFRRNSLPKWFSKNCHFAQNFPENEISFQQNSGFCSSNFSFWFSSQMQIQLKWNLIHGKTYNLHTDFVTELANTTNVIFTRLREKKKVLGNECKKDGLDSYVVQKAHRRTLQIYDQQYQRCRHN